LYPPDNSVFDTIPVYENFCFALALFRQKSAESVSEGKELIERLLAFQTPSGNFPIYLHDFPRCWDFLLPLKIAPILIHLLRDFGTVIAADLKGRIQSAIDRMIQYTPVKVLTPLWECRLKALKSEPFDPLDSSRFTAEEWVEWIITCQLSETCPDTFPISFNSRLHAFIGPGKIPQEKGEPSPFAIEYILSGESFSSRLLKDHPQQILSAPLYPFGTSQSTDASHSITMDNQGHLRLLWEPCHSLAVYNFTRRSGTEFIFDLPEVFQPGDFEAAFFCNISSDTDITIEGRKATVFQLGERISIQTPQMNITLVFTADGGTFCGHLSRANRPLQTHKGYEAFDWQIGLRTLRRSPQSQIRASLTVRLLQGVAVS
jgi:hypothetical protein